MEFHFFEIASILLVFAAIFGVVNHHVVRLPFAIGMMVASMVASLLTLGIDVVFPAWELGEVVRATLEQVDFSEVVLEGMLGLLLFAGALHTDLEALLEEIGASLVLASVGLFLSTGIVAGIAWWLFALFGLDVGLLPCLILGAVMSPTDPVAVLGIIRAAGAPEEIEVKIVGESLFNDGFAVVLFSVLVTIAFGASGHGGGDVTAWMVAELLGKEVVGGCILGLAAGYVGYLAMYTLDEPNLEILISAAVVTGLSTLAFKLHVSAPLGAVCAGLLIGNRGRTLAMSEKTRESLDIVWNFIEEALNAVLFLLIGFEVIAIPFDAGNVYTALLLIPVVVLSRFVAVAGPMTMLAYYRDFLPGARRILTWGGLKGGISIAMAMSLPAFEGRDPILTATYATVVFSIVVQGLTVGKLIEHLFSDEPESGVAA